MLGLQEIAQRRVRPWLAHAHADDLQRPAVEWLRLSLDMARRARAVELLTGAPPVQVLSALAISVAGCMGALASVSEPTPTLHDVLAAADRLEAWLMVADDEADLVDMDATVIAFGRASAAAEDVWDRWSAGAHLRGDEERLLEFAVAAVRVLTAAASAAEPA